MKQGLLFLMLFLGFFSGCQKKDKTLFKLLDPSKTGVTFNNKIVENATYNILDIYYLYNGGGVSVGDFDQNGLTDLFFTGNMVENKLYLNQGNMKFKDVSEVAGIGALGKWSYGSSVVDLNGDGLLDIYVCSSISASPEERSNMLFINQGLNEEGIPVFKDEASSFGLENKNHSTHASFFDYDQDGDLDVLVLVNSKIEGIPSVYKHKVNDGTSPINDQLFRNNGDGTFTEVSTEAGITSEGFALGIATSDLNKDGYVDVYVGNDFITNDLLYINNNGKFKESIDEAIKHQSRFSMGNDIADINNDGHLDIITLDMLPETNLRKKTVIIPNGYIVYINDFQYGYTHQYIRNMLQVNNGNMKFSEIGQLAGVHQTEWSWSPLFADFDNDGFKDLVVTNGYPRDITDLDFINFRMETSGFVSNEDLLKQIPSVKIPNYAFHNNGDLTFDDFSEKWGFTQPSFSNGAAFADLDNDGDLDYIVNNINDPAFIYENTANDDPENRNNYLRIKLNGTPQNPSAFGARITITYDEDQQQYHELNVYRGYVSTVEDIAHFGLGKVEQVDQVLVEWPGGLITTLSNVNVNQLLTLEISDAQPMEQITQEPANALLAPANESLEVDFTHKEFDFIDYNLQRGIPHKFSQFGPALAVGDINGDELEDFFVGGPTQQDGIIFLQNADGTFRQHSGGPNTEKLSEDLGTLLFDADGDGDNDLYIVSGSMEQEAESEHYQDRLYLNDGKGNLTIAPSAIPELKTSGSCVRGADFDQDGDIDLFIGGRVAINSYPLPPNSYLLENNDGKFTDVTSTIASDLSKIGMVTDAVWTDYDNDNDADLMVVGEFMAITLFENQDGKLQLLNAEGLDKKGFWNSIISGDFDKDGDPDYVAGNLGLNNFYCASDETPVSIVAKDFDQNGGLEAIMSCYFKAEDGSMKPFPVLSWQELNNMSPIFRKRFTSYQEFGKTTIDNLLTEEEKEGALMLQMNYQETSYIENLGNGAFKITPLPREAQVAPVNGIATKDINQDGELDLLLIGNDYGNEVNMGQYDALIGLALIGDGAGHFQPLSVLESGFLVDGDGKALTTLLSADGNQIVLASKNRGRLDAYTLVGNPQNRVIETGPNDFKAILTYPDGKKQYVDILYGGGFLSQSSRRLVVPSSVVEIEIVDYAGASRIVALN